MELLDVGLVEVDLGPPSAISAKVRTPTLLALEDQALDLFEFLQINY